MTGEQPAPMRVQHIKDVDHYYTGSAGEWTACGLPWPTADDDPEAAVACTACLDAWVPAHERRRS